MLSVAMLPLLMGASSAGRPAPMPTAAGIRSAVVRLADWVSGQTPPKPVVPRQAAGKVPGKQHQVPVAVTRAVARAEGRAPGKGAGQLPPYAVHAAKVKRYATAAGGRGGPGSFSATSSGLVPSGATATSDLYRNADGSYTRLEYPTPVNRQAASGQWIPIGTAAADGPGATTARGTLAFPGPAGVGVKGTHVTSASLRVLETWTGQCPASASVNVSDSSGQQVGRWAGRPAASACGTHPNGSWISVPISAAGLRALNSRSGGNLTVTSTPTAIPSASAAISSTPAATPAAVTGATAAKTAIPSAPAAAMVLMVTAASNLPPQVNAQWPTNDANTPTLTPELIASGSDSDGDALQYQFSVYDSSGDWLAGSKWISSNDWVVPSGTLAWAQTYYWTVTAYDNGNPSLDPQAFAFQTPVPQPLVSSGLAQDGGGAGDAPDGSGPGFDPQNGNFTTQATDVTVPVTGPALSLQRTYNSLNPSAAGSFGSGWSSVLDMKVGPGQTGAGGSTATEVVAYPDGEQVAFGVNSDGTYTPPQGRHATLESISGGFELADKNDTTYVFTRSLGSGSYGVTSITDAQGHALNFTYSSSGQITQLTSAVSQRSLYLTWATPAGAKSPHVTAVSTNPVTPGTQSTAITWQYNYSGDQLSSACNQSQSGQPCTAYTYQAGSAYPSAVLDSGPQSYWRLNETSGATAASSVLANEGTDNGTYINVVQDVQAGPLAGSPSSVGAAGFDEAAVQVPDSLADEAATMSISLWFNSTATNGVLFSESADPITNSTTTDPSDPVLYIGSDGKLQGSFAGTGTPISSAAAVNNGNWHNVVLTAAGSQEVMYLDGVQVASKTVTVSPFIEPYIYLGTGFLGGSYPDESNAGKSPAVAAGLYGAMSDVATWTRPLTAAQVAALYSAGTGAAALLTKITRPSGQALEQVSYSPVTAQVTHVTDANNGSWTVTAPTMSGSSQVYANAVESAEPQDYWRLADTGTSTAVNQVHGGNATYNTVTQGVTGGPFSDTTVDGLNGSSSYVTLPSQLISPGQQSVSLWFKTTSTDEVLLSSSVDPIGNATTADTYTPNLYIGQDGYLWGEYNYQDTPMESSQPVNDGKWHNVVLAAGSDQQTLYLDGQSVGSVSGTIGGGYGDGENYDYVGAGFLGWEWPDQPNPSSGTEIGNRTYFNGDIAEVAFYPQQLTPANITTEWNAAQHSPGLTPVETATVTDPGGHTLTYRYDPLNSGRVLSQTDGLGDTTTYGYDTTGFQDSVIDPDGNVSDTGFDVRGNAVSTTTCQDGATGRCSTSYFTYQPNDTSSWEAPSPTNDLQVSYRDPRSSSPTDNTYLTTDAYNSAGELTTETTPPVPGYPSGRTTTFQYTNGTSTAGGATGSTVPPAGLLWETTSPGGAITQTLYYADGDIAKTINADGASTSYTYDGIGRKTTQTAYSDTYPNGLVTSYTYNANGQVTQQTDPAVTDRVTGAVHTPQITTSYDADGDTLSEATADTTGGDASRTVSYTYNSLDQRVTAADAAGAVTHYTYDAYGNQASQTDPAGNVTEYTYDPNGNLLTTTLENYTGSPSGSQSAASLIEESRAYDPSGRLASVTDAMGRVTSYTYTDNGLTASVTDTGSGGGRYVQEADTYDPAGNLLTQVTDNGATTTDYIVNAANKPTSETLDPNGLDRVTSYTYDPDDDVATQAVSQGSASPVQSMSYTYDPMGNMTSEQLGDPGAEGPDGWWTLTQTSGSAVADTSGTGNLATASGVTWSGSGAGLTGQSGQEITTRGPVVDTTGSFTVTAWVKMAAKTGTDEDVVSQDAGSVAGFYLKYNSSTGTWQFVRPEEDESNPPNWASAGSTTAQTGTWVFLAGVYNANTGAVQLYVNGTDNGADGSDPSPIPANGPLEIGAAKWNGQAGQGTFDGSVSNVEAYPHALSASDVSDLYGQGLGGGDITWDGLTTNWQLDQLGQVTAETDPDGVITDYAYDQEGRLAVTTGPPVVVETRAVPQATARAVTTTGYDTFGDATESKDPDGNVTTYSYDADGRPVTKVAPTYTQPGTSTAVNGTSTTKYNALGQITGQTDPDGSTTTYGYDQLGDQTGQTDPDGGVTTTSYDADGEQLSQTGPTGAQTTATYDYLGRPATSTQVERYPSAASYTTTTSYAPTAADPSGTWKSSVATPDGEATSYGYNAAGETTQVTDGAGNTTHYSYDALGRTTDTVNPDGTSATVGYDPAGNEVAQSSLSASGQTLATQTATFDGDGDQLSTTDALGDTTAYTYDPDDNLTSETQPVSSSSGIVTSFGYDAAGNQTVYTDGRGNQWLTTYNSWNLPEDEAVPSTSQYSSWANSASVIAYNGDGLPAWEDEPGGVSRTYSYNNMDEVTGESGSGATAATANRSFSYDEAGNMLTAATSNTAASGQPSNATSETFSYDDRALPLTAAGSAGSTAYTWNGDGQQASVQDAAGTTSYGYDSDGRLRTLNDPASGATLTYSYNPMSQVSQISYGTDVQAFGYDGLHRLTTDTLTSGAATVASIGYGYNADGELTSKTTTGFAGASANTYTYDQAGRLTSWNNGSSTTQYAYDASGNRVQAGSATYTYDARDELTSDGTSSYAYAADGDLSTVSGPSGTVTSTSDAYGQQGAQGSQADVYDALGRDVGTAVTNGATTALSYEGISGQLASDGNSAYTWTPGGTLIGTETAGNPGAGVLDFTDRHTDLTGQFTAAGTTLTGSQAFGPWGAAIATGGTLAGSLGYQSQYTSPTTGQVDMGARWYNPATGSFGDKDTTANKPVPDSASASPFGYAADNPLDLTDPTGHMAILDINGIDVPAKDPTLIAAVEKATAPPPAKKTTVSSIINSVFKAKPAPKPAPKPAAKPAPKPAPKPATKTTTKPAPKTTTKPVDTSNDCGSILVIGSCKQSVYADPGTKAAKPAASKSAGPSNDCGSVVVIGSCQQPAYQSSKPSAKAAPAKAAPTKAAPAKAPTKAPAKAASPDKEDGGSSGCPGGDIHSSFAGDDAAGNNNCVPATSPAGQAAIGAKGGTTGWTCNDGCSHGRVLAQVGIGTAVAGVGIICVVVEPCGGIVAAGVLGTAGGAGGAASYAVGTSHHTAGGFAVATAAGVVTSLATFGAGLWVGTPGVYFVTPAVGGVFGFATYLVTSNGKVDPRGVVVSTVGGAGGGVSIDAGDGGH
jgi:RHS repeat-associated protein